MQFVVNGVDRETGQDTSLTLNAANATEAESIATLSMLVADVQAQPTPVAAVGYAQRNTESGFDWPAGISHQSRVLRGLSWVCACYGIMGFAMIPFGHLGLIFNTVWLDRVIGFGQSLAPENAGIALIYLVGGCLLRLMAHFSLGFREILLQKIDRER